ncbi:phosphate transporter [Phlyctochytrium bullatum]|nr:phosphate transporter [Phlyctochytrium bullatum]
MTTAPPPPSRLSIDTAHSDDDDSLLPAPAKAAAKHQAYEKLDNAKLGWFHVRAVLVSGVGFFTDAYDIFVISQALPMIYQVHFAHLVNGSYTPPANVTTPSPSPIPYTPQTAVVPFHALAPHVDALLKATTSWGNLVGQLLFGYLADVYGRKRLYGVELVIMVVCALGSSLAFGSGFGLLTLLGVWRFVLGVGIGGDYPMSATVTAEFATTRHRGMLIAGVFAFQGVGIVAGGIVFLALLAAFRTRIQEDYRWLDYVWRLALGVGVIPALAGVYFRMTIPETPRFTADVQGDTHKATADVDVAMELNRTRNLVSTVKEKPAPVKPFRPTQNTLSDFKLHFGRWKNLKVLVGAAYCWFALDVAWYGLALNQSVVLELINFNGPKKEPGGFPPHDIWSTFNSRAIGNIILAAAFTLPGYLLTVLLIDRVGRKPIQYLGFILLAALLALLALLWPTLVSDHPALFVAVFGAAQLFFQFGPNATTFVVPAEVFPTRWRSTGHGIAAAAGKVGAILGVQVVAPWFAGNARAVLAAFAVVMASGAFATILLPETKGKSLEELSGEDEEVPLDEFKPVARGEEEASGSVVRTASKDGGP